MIIGSSDNGYISSSSARTWISFSAVFVSLAHVYTIPQTAQLKLWDRACRRVCSCNLLPLADGQTWAAPFRLRRQKSEILRAQYIDVRELRYSHTDPAFVCLGPVTTSLTVFLPSVVLWQNVISWCSFTTDAVIAYQIR